MSFSLGVRPRLPLRGKRSASQPKKSSGPPTGSPGSTAPCADDADALAPPPQPLSHCSCILPHECILNIFGYLDARSLALVSSTCKLFNQLCNDPSIWKRLALRRWCSSTSTPSDGGGILRHPMVLHQPPSSSCNWKQAYWRVSCAQRNWSKGKFTCKTIKAHSGDVRCLHMFGDSLVSGSRDKSIKRWDLLTRTCTKTYTGHKDHVYSIQSDERKIISGSADKTIRIWDVSSGKCLSSLKGHTAPVLSLQYDSTHLVTGGGDNVVKYWDLESETCVHTLKGHTDWVSCLQFDRSMLVTGSVDETIRVWDSRASHSRCVQLIKWAGSVYCLQFAKNVILSGTSGKTVDVWDMRSGSAMASLSGHSGWVFSLQSDRTKLVSGSFDTRLKVWVWQNPSHGLFSHTPRAKCRYSLSGHTGFVSCLQYDHTRLISGSQDKTIRIWNFAPKNKEWAKSTKRSKKRKGSDKRKKSAPPKK